MLQVDFRFLVPSPLVLCLRHGLHFGSVLGTEMEVHGRIANPTPKVPIKEGPHWFKTCITGQSPEQTWARRIT